MPDIRHAWDAEMLGRNRFEKWQSEFMAKWHEPETVMVEAYWKQIKQNSPPELIEMMKAQMDPDMRTIVEGFDNGTDMVK